jgi:hypothetical protein
VTPTPRRPAEPAPTPTRISLTVPLDRRGVETFQLEARRIARRFGLKVDGVQVRKLDRNG